MIWAGLVAHMEAERSEYRAFVEKSEGKRPLGSLKRRWEYNITLDLYMRLD